MDLNFTKVTYDGDLSDFDADDLRELIKEFENAQESNVAEFNEAADKLDEVEDFDLDEYQDAKSDLIGDITEADAFEDVPLTEGDLEDADFGTVREWHDFVSSQATDEGDEDGDADFDDMGEDPDLDGGDGGEGEFDSDLVEVVDGLSGVNVQE